MSPMSPVTRSYSPHRNSDRCLGRRYHGIRNGAYCQDVFAGREEAASKEDGSSGRSDQSYVGRMNYPGAREFLRDSGRTTVGQYSVSEPVGSQHGAPEYVAGPW